MASFTGRWESCRDVVHRSYCVVVIVLVARNAGGAGQVVIVVDVAVGTLSRRNRMRSGQRESGAAVIKSRIQPRTRVVALIAGLGKVRRDVVRIGRALVVGKVTAHARRIRNVVVVVNVAVGAQARRHGMHSR